MDSTYKKSLIRKEMKQLRSQLSESDALKRSRKTAAQLFKLPELIAAETVFCYVSFSGELSTHQLIEQLLIAGKTVLVPKIINKIMYPVEITSFFDLEPNNLGIPEPIHSLPGNDQIDICLTPGLAFTRDGDRLGFGGGYYDRFFQQNTDILKIALAYDFQILANLPVNSNDQKVDLIATENELINCANKLELGQQTGRSIRRILTQHNLFKTFKNSLPFIGTTS